MAGHHTPTPPYTHQRDNTSTTDYTTQETLALMTMSETHFVQRILTYCTSKLLIRLVDSYIYKLWNNLYNYSSYTQQQRSWVTNTASPEAEESPHDIQALCGKGR